MYADTGGLLARASYNINAVRPFRSIISIFYLSILFLISSFVGDLYHVFFFVFIVPLVIGYQISAFVEICSEHAWFDTEIRTIEELRKDPFFYADISWGRFCGERCPQGSYTKVLIWYIKHILYHFPVRCLILVGDLPQHDFHHRKPLFNEWVYSNYERQKHAGNLNDNEPEYFDIWSLHNAIDHVFTVLSNKTEEDYRKIMEFDVRV